MGGVAGIVSLALGSGVGGAWERWVARPSWFVGEDDGLTAVEEVRSSPRAASDDWH